MFCGSCSNPILHGNRFCPHCGTAIDAFGTPAAAPAIPPRPPPPYAAPLPQYAPSAYSRPLGCGAPMPPNLHSRLNGKVVQQAPTSDLLFGPPEIVGWISQAVTLTPGDVIYTGTPGQTTRMAPGDSVEVEIEGIGVLRNPVKSE